MPPCEFKACRKRSLLPAFSLIELLVVMAIVLALAGIAANGIFGSSQNARLTSRDRVKVKLQQARAHAIATRNPTALIVPVGISGKYALRAMSLIEVEKIDGRYVPMENENGDTALVQRWTVLPGNFHFVTNRMIGSEQPTVVDLENTLTIRQRGNEIDCHMIVFAPNGQIAWPSSGSPIHIAIAQVAGNRNSFRISEISNEKPVFDLLLVNRLTAQTRSIKP
jgi:prepilin-type N-terminal cleavage/methylation domain-containing protein